MPAHAIGARLDRGVEVDVLAVGEPLEHAPRVGPQQLELTLDLGEELGLLAARGVELGGGLLLEAGLGETAPGAAVARVLVVPLVVVVDAAPRRQIAQLVLELAREGTDRAGETLANAVAHAVGEPGQIDRREARRLVERAPLARFDLDLAALEHLAQHLGRKRSSVGRDFAQVRDSSSARRSSFCTSSGRGAPRKGTGSTDAAAAASSPAAGAAFFEAAPHRDRLRLGAGRSGPARRLHRDAANVVARRRTEQREARLDLRRRGVDGGLGIAHGVDRAAQDRESGGQRGRRRRRRLDRPRDRRGAHQAELDQRLESSAVAGRGARAEAAARARR